jgi:hypothetical protein
LFRECVFEIPETAGVSRFREIAVLIPETTDYPGLVQKLSKLLTQKKDGKMDMMITAVVAVLITIISTLIAVITKKSIMKIVFFAVIGLILGIPAGYLLAPFIISFL